MKGNRGEDPFKFKVTERKSSRLKKTKTFLKKDEAENNTE